MNENNPPINWQQLDDITGNDRELGMEFLVFFLENAHTYIDELQAEAISPEDFSNICHKLKGAAKSVGAEALADLALSGEKMQDQTKLKQTALVKELKISIGYIEKGIK